MNTSADPQASLKEEILKINSTFSEEELEAGLRLFEKRSFTARDNILTMGNPCDFLYFAEQSISRCYFKDELGEEKTLWMEPAKMFITDFESFIKGNPSQCYLQFYQDSDVWIISRKNLLFLYENHKNWTIFGIKLMEEYHMRILDLFMILFRNDASENYQFIEEKYREFLQVAPLKDIASMLNVSPVTLSRIRAGKQKKV